MNRRVLFRGEGIHPATMRIYRLSEAADHIAFSPQAAAFVLPSRLIASPSGRPLSK